MAASPGASAPGTTAVPRVPCPVVVWVMALNMPLALRAVHGVLFCGTRHTQPDLSPR